MFVLGGLLCALFGAIEDVFEDVFAWVAGKIRREDAAPEATDA